MSLADEPLGHTTPQAIRYAEDEDPRTEAGPELLRQPEPLRKRILLADDDASVRQMLGRVLEAEGYAVTFARTGREAAAKFAAEVPDLVLLDLNMPDKDGWEAFGMMCDTHPLVPVIVITARPHQHGQAIELGVDALMEKPLHLPLLLETMRKLLVETEAERTRRLADPGFRTTFLKDHFRRSIRQAAHGHTH